VTSPSGRVRAEIWRATLVAFGLSVTVEGLQVFSPVRTASIVDVTTNTLGALGGAIAMAVLVTAVVRARGGHFLLGVPTFLLAGAGAGLAFAAELIHGAFGLSIRWEATATHALVVGAGAWAAQRWLPSLREALRGWARARAAIATYAGLLVLWGWRPFFPRTD